jgi:O-antigen/teichoic acid export membrane protein
LTDKQTSLDEHAAAARDGDGLHLKALHGVKWATVANWLAQAAGFVTMIVLARMLLPDEFGIYAIGSSVVMILGGLSQIGLPLALVQREHVEQAHFHSAFWCVTGFALLLATAAFLGREAIAAIMGLPTLASLVPVLALALPIQAMAGIFNAPLMRSLDFRRAAIATSAGAIAGAAAAIAMALAGFGLWSLVAQSLVAAAVTLGVLVAVSPYRPSWIFSVSRLRELWSFGALSMVTDFVSLTDLRLGSVLLGGLLGPRAAGLYAMSRRVIDMGQQVFVASIGQVAMPAFSRLAGQPARMRTAYLNAVQSVAALTFPLFGFLAVMSREVVVIFLGTGWEEGAPVLRFLALAALFQSYGWISTSALAALGRASLRLGVQVLSLGLSIAVLAAAWREGLVAVALGFLLKSLIMHVALFAAVSRAAGISARNYVTAVGPVGLAAAVALASSYFLRPVLDVHLTSTPLIVACVGPAGVLYLIVLRLLAPSLATRVIGYAVELLRPLARIVR